MKGNFHSLKVYEIDKYLSYHGLTKKGKKEDKVKTVMHHELRNIDPVRIKSTAKTASIDNNDNDNDDCDVGSNFVSDSEEGALAISAHTVNPRKEERKNLRTYRLSFLN